MQAIILAAGQGRRLRDLLGRPKCLRKVGGEPLVHHQLRALVAAGVDDVTMVVGYQQGDVRAAVGSAARYVVNSCYAQTNSLYSFMLAVPVIDDDVVVMNSDLFFHPELVNRLLDAGPDALLFDSGSGKEDEQMKVEVEDGRLVEMSKVMGCERVHGENVGMVHLAATTAWAAADAADAIIANGHQRAWLAEAINVVAAGRRISCVDVAGFPWVEIDFPGDLARARSEVLPAISGAIDQLCGELLVGARGLRRVS